MLAYVRPAVSRRSYFAGGFDCGHFQPHGYTGVNAEDRARRRRCQKLAVSGARLRAPRSVTAAADHVLSIEQILLSTML